MSARSLCRMQAGSIWLLLGAFFMAFVVGCNNRGPQLAQSIQAAGGMETLKTECADLVLKFQSAQMETIDATNHPPVVAKLKPQIVRIEEQGSLPFVHIQITGGFDHHGLLVSGKSLPSGFMPVRGGGGRLPTECLNTVNETELSLI